MYNWWMSWTMYWLEQFFTPVTHNEARYLRECHNILRERVDKIEKATIRHGVV
jgi:hypothetical protein